MDLQERIRTEGIETVSDAELLAVLLRFGDAERTALELGTYLLAAFGGLREVCRTEYAELLHVAKLRPKQVVTLQAAAEVARRITRRSSEMRPRIQNGKDVATLLLLEMERLKQEQLRVILLDAQRHVMAIPTVYIGSLHATIIRAAEVFRQAITRNCAGIILVHNHPSGDPTPSPEDLQLTEQLIQAGTLLDIPVLDHIIIGHGEWVSLRDVGVAF